MGVDRFVLERETQGPLEISADSTEVNGPNGERKMRFEGPVRVVDEDRSGDGDVDGVFPIRIKGDVVNWILRWGSSIYIVTENGWVYQTRWRANLVTTTAETPPPRSSSAPATAAGPCRTVTTPS